MKTSTLRGRRFSSTCRSASVVGRRALRKSLRTGGLCCSPLMFYITLAATEPPAWPDTPNLLHNSPGPLASITDDSGESNTTSTYASRFRPLWPRRYRRCSTGPAPSRRQSRHAGSTTPFQPGAACQQSSSVRFGREILMVVVGCVSPPRSYAGAAIARRATAGSSSYRRRCRTYVLPFSPWAPPRLPRRRIRESLNSAGLLANTSHAGTGF